MLVQLAQPEQKVKMDAMAQLDQKAIQVQAKSVRKVQKVTLAK